MGKCFSSTPESNTNNVLPDIFYLFRDKKYLLRISNNVITKYRLDSTIKIRKDSGVGYLNDGRLIVAGGTDSSGCLTNKAYIINPSKFQILHITNLPISTKEGNFFQYKNFVYYIAAIKEADDEKVVIQEQMAPIMKYYLDEGHWEIFNFQKKRDKEKISLDKYLEYNKKGEEKSESEVRLEEILYPGTFMIGSKIFLINSQRFDSRGMLRQMNSVFSIDLEDDNFCFAQEKCECPIKTFRPACGSYGNKGIISGGFDSNTKKNSRETYSFTYESNQLSFEKITGLKVEIDDCYPIISNNRYHIALSYPNFIILDTLTNNWQIFVFEEIYLRRNQVNYTTPVLQSEVGNKGKIFQNTAHFSTNFYNSSKSINSDDLNSGVSMSDYSPPNAKKLQLPIGVVFETDHSEKANLSCDDSNTYDGIDREQQLFINVKSPNTSRSSVNLSDRSNVKPSHRKLAPIANLAKNNKVVHNKKIEIESDDSEDFDVYNRQFPGIMIKNESNSSEINFSYGKSEKSKEKFNDSDSSDFELSVNKENEKKINVLVMPVNNNEVASKVNTQRYSEKTEKSESKESESSNYIVSVSERDLEKNESFSSDFEFDVEVAQKVPILKPKTDESSNSVFSLNNSRDKQKIIDVHHESSSEIAESINEKNSESIRSQNPLSSFGSKSSSIDLSKGSVKIEDFKISIDKNKKNIQDDKQERENTDEMEESFQGPEEKNNLKIESYEEGRFGIIIPKKVENNIVEVDEDFGFESSRNIELPKLSARGHTSSRKPSPMRPKPIHIRKKSSKANIKESPVEKKINLASKFKKNKVAHLDKSSDSFEALEKIKKTKTIKPSKIRKLSDSSSDSQEKKVMKKNSKIKENISINSSGSESVQNKLNFDKYKMNDIDLVKIPQIIQLTCKIMKIPAVTAFEINKLLEKFKGFNSINLGSLEGIFENFVPDDEFKVNIIEKLLLKMHSAVKVNKIQSQRLLEIYNSADINESTRLVDKKTVIFCIIRGINILVNG